MEWATITTGVGSPAAATKACRSATAALASSRRFRKTHLMRTRALFTVLTLSVAGAVGIATGAAVNDFGSAFVAVAVLTLGVLVIGLLEWDHARPAESRSAVRDGGSRGSPDTQEATDRGHSEDPGCGGAGRSIRSVGRPDAWWLIDMEERPVKGRRIGTGLASVVAAAGLGVGGGTGRAGRSRGTHSPSGSDSGTG